MISPKESQAFGLAASAITGLAIFVAIWGFFVWKLDFWYLEEVLGPVLGFIGGCLSAYAMYTTGMRNVPLYWVGVGLFLGKPDDTLYENGIQWVSPFGGIRNVPGPDQKFILKMPGEMFNAQDGNLVYFGISPEEPEKRNRIQYSVTKPRLYIAVDAPEDELREAYLEKARLFFGQATKAYGVKNEQTLFSDYIILPPRGSEGFQKKYDDFAKRLEAAKYTPRGGESDQPVELFTKESRAIIMDNAGEFLDSAAGWGIGNIFAFTPNVRENPEMEAADAARQATVAKMSAAKTKTVQIKESAMEFVSTGVSPDLAAALGARLAGEEIEIDNKTWTISGLPEVLKAAVDAFANKK